MQILQIFEFPGFFNKFYAIFSHYFMFFYGVQYKRMIRLRFKVFRFFWVSPTLGKTLFTMVEDPLEFVVLNTLELPNLSPLSQPKLTVFKSCPSF